MTEIITATFQDGAFVPEVAHHVHPGARVRLIVQYLESEQPNNESSLREFDDLCDNVSVDSARHLTRQELHDRG